ncbi:hypothetical protein NDU88_003552 [Pleurodeles waltl]|uniref:Uncharacterized protein n=1 Tax=Pleurodeles waltl TaxID=8319 RepID=A0AAV7WSR6_PLEWA|nr:hypothetical protein NDU88_003552 [Pleurodeles waltl]
MSAILASHTQKFDDILNAVQSIKSTLEHKIDALCIDMGHMREEHKKLKDRVASAEGASGVCWDMRADADGGLGGGWTVIWAVEACAPSA